MNYSSKADKMTFITQVAPTTFDDDEDPPSEDEDGNEVPVLKDGVFANQNFERLRSKCLASGKVFVDPIFPPSNASLYFDDTKGNQLTQLSNNAPRFVLINGSSII